MKLSVIIVNYNVQYFLEQCILSLKAASKNMLVEIVVVDNNSSDGSCEMLLEKYPEVVLIANIKNVGFSIANNQGVRKAQGSYVLILNPDTVLAEDTLDHIVSYADQKSDLGALGVKFIDGTGNFLPECKRRVPTVQIAMKKILGNSDQYYAGHIDENENAEVEILCGAFMLMKKNTFLSVGGFDEEYFMYGEDIDLSYKLLNKGCQNYYLGSTAIIHYKGQSTVKDIVNFKYFYGAMEIFYRKHFQLNPFQKLFSNWFFKFLTFYKSVVVKKKTEIKRQKKVVQYIGNNQKIFDDIISQKIFEKGMKSLEFKEFEVEFDTLIFDNNDVLNKTIIAYFQKLKERNIAKRILPKGTNFYLGSDHFDSKGEIVNLSKY